LTSFKVYYYAFLVTDHFGVFDHVETFPLLVAFPVNPCFSYQSLYSLNVVMLSAFVVDGFFAQLILPGVFALRAAAGVHRPVALPSFALYRTISATAFLTADLDEDLLVPLFHSSFTSLFFL
jgi:hypothetical protein